MLRIGIDTFSFDSPGENFGVGPGVYAWHLLNHLVAIGTRHSFIVFANRENATFVPNSPNVEVVVSPFPTRPRFFRPFHEQLAIPWYVKRHRLDCVHFLGNNLSYFVAQRAVLTVYDLMWKYYLSLGARNLKYRYFSLTVPASLRRARALVAISSYVAEEIHETFGVPRDHITAIPLAPGRLKEPGPGSFEKFRRDFNSPFLFSVTTSYPNKNLKVLIEAFALLRKSNAYKGRLVVAGQLRGPYLSEIRIAIAKCGVGNDIKLIGFVSETVKTLCYRNADLVVCPSLYEGFGLPLLEAMQCGTPVVSSRSASLPEVGGNACEYFDPLSSVDLASKIEKLLADKTRQTELVRLGYERVSTFSWHATANATLELYERVFSPRGG